MGRGSEVGGHRSPPLRVPGPSTQLQGPLTSSGVCGTVSGLRAEVMVETLSGHSAYF